MTEEKIIDAIGNIDDSLIEETAKLRKRKRTFPYAVPAIIAACILITVALLPWKTMFSNNTPAQNKPINSDTGIGILQNSDTTRLDTTKEQEDSPVIIPEESTQQVTEDTTIANIQNNVEDTTQQNTQTDTKIPDTNAAETMGPNLSGNKDTEKEAPSEIPKKEETTGPFLPSTPSNPDNGVFPTPQRPSVLARTSYPLQAQYPTVTSLRPQWRSEKTERINYYKSGIGNTSSFMFRTLCEFFSNSENENLIYSPVNIYMTLGMLTETTAGNSRTQLLSLLGENDISSLRSSANNLWNSCYRDDGIVTTILGNSMWLDNSFTPKTEVTDILAMNYYASSFRGNTGDEEYNKLMRSWLNEQTKGLLKNTVANKSLDPESILTLMPTVYFKANWEDGFDSENTTTKVFRSANGDVTTQFMEKEHYELYYVGESFTATRMTFMEGEEMWFILPNENVNPLSLFLDYEAMGFITCETQKTLSKSNKRKNVVLSLPKFDITSEMDLVMGLKNLGITDIFDESKADFSALTDSKISVGKINHSVRMRIDENGFEAATMSETVLPSPPHGDTSKSIEFMLDRPFIFVITSDSDLPLFVGMVNCPN